MVYLSGFYPLVLCCFLYFSLISSKPLDSPTTDKLTEGLRSLPDNVYKGFLFLAVGAASSGKTLFKTPQTLSEDCIRTSRVIMQLFEKPSTIAKTTFLLNDGVKEIFKYQTNSTFDNLVNRLCEELSKQAKEKPYGFSDFDERRKGVAIPKPATNFIVEIPSDQNVVEWATSESFPFNDSEFVKFNILMWILSFRISTLFTLDQQQLFVIAIATEKLSLNSSAADDVFTKNLDHFIKNLLTEDAKEVHMNHLPVYTTTFLKKVDQVFLSNELLKDSYSKMKKEATDQAHSKFLHDLFRSRK